MLKLTARVSVVPATDFYPEHWNAEVVHGLPQTHYRHVYCYADAATRQEAIAAIVADLKARGYHGALRVQG